MQLIMCHETLLVVIVKAMHTHRPPSLLFRNQLQTINNSLALSHLVPSAFPPFVLSKSQPNAPSQWLAMLRGYFVFELSGFQDSNVFALTTDAIQPFHTSAPAHMWT